LLFPKPARKNPPSYRGLSRIGAVEARPKRADEGAHVEEVEPAHRMMQSATIVSCTRPRRPQFRWQVGSALSRPKPNCTAPDSSATTRQGIKNTISPAGNVGERARRRLQSTRLSIRAVGAVDPVARSLRSPELHRRPRTGISLKRNPAPPATSPSCSQQPLHRPGGPSRSSCAACHGAGVEGLLLDRIGLH